MSFTSHSFRRFSQEESHGHAGTASHGSGGSPVTGISRGLLPAGDHATRSSRWGRTQRPALSAHCSTCRALVVRLVNSTCMCACSVCKQQYSIRMNEFATARTAPVQLPLVNDLTESSRTLRCNRCNRLHLIADIVWDEVFVHRGFYVFGLAPMAKCEIGYSYSPLCSVCHQQYLSRCRGLNLECRSV